MNCIPAVTNLTHLMNESFLLRREKQLQDAFEVDSLVGGLLISTKRFVQATEILRRIQATCLDSNRVKAAVLELLVAESMC